MEKAIAIVVVLLVIGLIRIPEFLVLEVYYKELMASVGGRLFASEI